MHIACISLLVFISHSAFSNINLDIDQTDPFDIQYDFNQKSILTNAQIPSEKNLLEQLALEEEANFNTVKQQFSLRNYKEIENSYDQATIKELLDSCCQDLLNIILTLECLTYHYLPPDHPMRKSIINKFLLIGPPGSGKSSLALVTALKCQRPYIFISASTLANEYKNSSVRIINDLFEPLINAQQPVVVILDEITAFVNRFNNKQDCDPGAVEHLWFMLDRCENNPNILIICTANSSEKIPDTIKDRFAGAQFYISHPDTNARRRILENQVADYLIDEQNTINDLAAKTDEWSLRELLMIIKLAKNKAFNRQRKKFDIYRDLQISKSDLELAFATVCKNHDSRMIEKKKEYYKQVYETIAPHMILY